jgi:hypothetical protein
MANRSRLAAALVICGALFPPATVASACSPHRETRGSFSTSCGWLCAGNENLADKLHGSNVWCKWNGDHVAVHIKLRNTGEHTVVASIRTSYWIRDHDRHGSSLRTIKSVEIDGDSTIDWTGDAGKPHDVHAGALIEKCGPSLYAIRKT